MERTTDDALVAAVDPHSKEIQSLQQVINERPNTAARLIENMTGKDRAIFAYYLRELGLMIENADETALAERRISR